MPVYAFEGRNEQSGEVVTGMREAASHAMLGQDLLSEGILLTRYEEKKQALAGSSFLSAIIGRVPILEKLLFARYFALMLRAGLDVKRSLYTLQQQTRSKSMAKALETLYQDVEKGDTLGASLAAFPYIFSPLFISFVRVGESTGRLQEALEILAMQLQKEFELRRAVRGGMLYPLVILVALVAVGIAMMVFVIPKLVEVFEGFNVELPLMTRMLIAISNFMRDFWYLVLIGVPSLIGLGWFLLRIKSVKETVLHSLLFTPVIGPILQKINVARFSRNLSSLLSSGVAFVEALKILGENTPHPSYAKVLAAAESHVKQGKVLSEFLADFKRLFPPLVTSIIHVGEETGALDEVLKEVALFYEGEVDQTMKNLTSVLEPILMVTIGLAVGALAVSVISPIYSLVNVI